MGTYFRQMDGYFEFSAEKDLPEQPKQVLALAAKPVGSLIDSGLPKNLSHLIVATTCPDTLAPSLGQSIIEKFSSSLSGCHSIDIVQGCAGGVSSLILGSQLSELNKSSVLVVHADAAKKSTSLTSRYNKIFGNGSYACVISYEDSPRGLIHSRSKQYKGLSDVVSVNLGHDAEKIIIKESKTMLTDPRKHLGLLMKNNLAIKLLKNAENFYLSFISETGHPDVLILHQVNPIILKYLASVFKKYKLEFINMAEKTGNCGAASVGIALNLMKDSMQGKKIILCSFGTGGVITAGFWQN